MTGHPVIPRILKANIGITYLQSNALVMNRKIPDNVSYGNFLHTDIG